MPVLHARSNSSSLSSNTITPTMQSLLIALTVLLALALVLVLALYLLHRRRARRNSYMSHASTGPGAVAGTKTRRSRHRRDNSVMTISAGHFYPSSSPAMGHHLNPSREKFIMGEMGDSTPSTPTAGTVPEIRITFPDDEDEKDRRSRVVLVKVTDMGGVGLEPVEHHGGPPRYEEKEGFRDVDLEKCGGLKELTI